MVDSGVRRYAQFDPATGMSRLVTGKISQAAADQRRGRAGRLSAGHCYRLWSEGTHASLAAQTAPEILHADLAPLALELCCWGAGTPPGCVGSIRRPPLRSPKRAIYCGRLEAIDDEARITPHGRDLARAGAHPRSGAYAGQGARMGCARLACDLAAILSERDVLRAEPGMRDVDLRLRVGAMRGRAAGLPARIPRRLARVAAGRCAARRAGSASSAPALTKRRMRMRMNGPEFCLPAGIPDRIGRARDGAGRYLLANGRGARFSEPQASPNPNSSSPRNSTERSARRAYFWPLPSGLRTSKGTSRRTSRRRAKSPGMSASRRCEPATSGAWVRSCSSRARFAIRIARRCSARLSTGCAASVFRQLPWSEALRQWQARVELMRKHGVRAPEPWPELGDATLTATLDDWAAPWITVWFAASISLGWISAMRCAPAYHMRKARSWSGRRRRIGSCRAELVNSDRLSGRRCADPVGAPAGNVRTACDAERGERQIAAGVEAAVARRPAGANHA